MAITRRYDLNLVNDHVIFYADGNTFLLDTGSPICIGEANAFDFMGETHLINMNNVMGKSIDSVGDFIGHPVDILMGLSVICKYGLHIDWNNATITFSKGEPDLPDDAVGILLCSTKFSVPKITAEINGTEGDIFVDTGAPIAYVQEQLRDGEVIEGVTKTDFSPMYPTTWDTDLTDSSISVHIENIISFTIPVQMGVLPTMLEVLMLKGSGVIAVVGGDLLKYFKYVAFDWEDCIMYVGMP
eukprot:TRINITY_DN11013_c0_g1_i1.p1 TRINITY_DN11013_c0_g1~~TRINITY_DN11013_c0_g1_i1.p1  ORF type:complete len:242 (-),score=52.35 TRINITY_DN11013_c0_g1_i1:79-804(-)